MLNSLLRKLFRHRPETDTAKATIEQARQLLDGGKHERAIDMLNPLIAREPDHAEGRFLRGTAKLDLQRTTEAMDDLKRAVSLDPREPRYLYNLAVAHWTVGDLGAATHLCKAVSAISDFRPAHVLLSNMSLGGEHYFRMLKRIHEHLKPATYLEIGVFTGDSLRVVHPDTLTLGIDPEPKLAQPAGLNQRIFAQTSDEFFGHHDVLAELGGRRIDLGFIDGMHQFEFALRDFINIERLSNPSSVILVHDCFPIDAQTARRDRVTTFWSGDIWRLIVLLRKHRPDLAVHTVTTPPTGLGMIFNLDPASRVLSDNMDLIVAEYLALDYATIEDRKDELLNSCPNEWPRIQALLDSRSAVAAPQWQQP